MFGAVVAECGDEVGYVFHAGEQGVGVVAGCAVCLQVVEDFGCFFACDRCQCACKGGGQQGAVEFGDGGGLVSNRTCPGVGTNPADEAVLDQHCGCVRVDGAVHATIHKNSGRH